MKNPHKVTPQMLRSRILTARATLDQLRQLENLILYDMGNPVAMSFIHVEILISIHRLEGVIQDAEAALREDGHL